MKGKAAIQRFISQSILAGNSRRQILKDICRKLNIQQKEISARRSKKWFNKKNKKIVKELPKDLNASIKMIDLAFKRCRRGMSGRMCVEANCNIQLLTQRYALEVKHGANNTPCSVYLYDMVHGQRQKLKVDGKLAFGKEYFFMGEQVLNTDYFLILFHKRYQRPDSTIFCLMKLDYENMSCKLLDTHVKPKRFNRVIAKISDSLEFLCESCEDENKFYRGRIVDSKIEFDSQCLKFEYVNERGEVKNGDSYVLATCRLVGNKLYAISLLQFYDGEEDAANKYILLELTLEKNRLKCQKVAEFGVEGKEDRITTTYCLTWIGNTCYFLMQTENTAERLRYHLYRYEFGALEATDMNWFVDNQHPSEIRNDDGVLTLCTRNYESRQHTWHWIPIHKPDTLFNLTMKWLRQWTLFMDPKEYSKFMKQLPAKIRPFER
ncbi:hypothetical protein M3Y97_01148100 [Aphelenchoides bicaudatus]|nr:hypothetical protein M3Y97_01148100 [Aphelenchoides bicaudatus]